MFSMPCDKVLHLAATHNFHHKVLFIHSSSCLDAGISIYPFIWALFATGCHYTYDNELIKVLCPGDQLHMIGNIQNWHGRNMRIVSLVENLFHMFTVLLLMIEAIAISLPQKLDNVLLAVLLYFLCHMTRCCILLPYRVAQKKVYTCMLQTLTSHKSHFLLIFDGKTYINEKVIHQRVYFSVCPS